jgi:hypothetical protein
MHPYISKLPLFVDMQQGVGELVLFKTSCLSVIILEKYFKLACRKKFMVALTTGIMLLLFTCMHFRVWGIL